jgi:Fe-S-cluster containining protein
MNKQPEMLTGTIPLNIAGKDVVLKVDAPASAVKIRKMLPVFQQITNTFVDIAIEQTEEKGKKISCKAGCGACCRQLVPIAEAETFHLRDLIEEMPESHKILVRDRFNAAIEELEQARLLEKLRHARELTIEERRKLGNEYFRLQIPCPFLEEESCSIHPMRPLACREYLVTSPAENCARPQDNIEGVTVPAKVSAVVSSLGSELPETVYKWLPLILALEWTETHEEDSTQHTGPEWVDEVIDRISSA